MQNIHDLIDWFMAHKTQIGTGMLTLAGMLQAGQTADQWHWVYIGPISFVLVYLGSLLAGSGITKSDQFYKTKIEIKKGTGDGAN